MISDKESKHLAGIVSVSKSVWEDQKLTTTQDWAAQETPIAFEYNCVSHAVMMATPADLEDFAVGFSLSEGIVNSLDEILDIEIADAEHGKVVSMIIGAEQLDALKERRRNLVGRTGCGICGAETIDEALQIPTGRITTSTSIKHSAIQTALTRFSERQELNKEAGAIHAAALCSEQGEIELLREDVGRHNALDKLVGALAKQKLSGAGSLERGFVLISSRASYEMVSKAAVLGAAVLVAVSGVTHLAVEIADKANMTLVGFSRPGKHSVYTCPERLV